MTTVEPRDITLFVDPPSHHFQRDRLFDLADPRLNRDNCLRPFAYLRNWFTGRGIRVYTADRLVRGEQRTATNVYVSMGILDHYPALAGRGDVVLSGLFALECPIVEPSLYRGLNRAERYFKRVFSFSDSTSLEPFVARPLRFEPCRMPQAVESVQEEIWSRSDRKFLVIINANKLPRLYVRELYTERLRAVEFFGRTGEIDLYGRNWDGVPYRMGRTRVPHTLIRVHRTFLRHWQRCRPDPLLVAARRASRGPVTSKAETLGQYAFSICFENMILKGWVTEKIFDCFHAGTIPVYLGAPDIEDYVPRECFVDMRLFSGYGDLRSYLKSLGDSEIHRYKENARAYLGSPEFRQFSKESFVSIFRRLVEEDAGVQVT